MYDLKCLSMKKIQAGAVWTGSVLSEDDRSLVEGRRWDRTLSSSPTGDLQTNFFLCTNKIPSILSDKFN